MNPDDAITVLKCIDTLPFPVGKTLLADILRGGNGQSIVKHNLDQLEHYGSLAYSADETKELINTIEAKGWINAKAIAGKRFWKVLNISPKGRQLLLDPTKLKSREHVDVPPTTITSADLEQFEHFGSFLQDYNNEQKKAIISPSSKILCIAGAGSGKTTVLTKRIEYLIKYRSVTPHSILAVTFTRKARQEMLKRLAAQHIIGVQVHTFNSFCEQLLRQHEHLLYEQPMTVLTYRDRIKLAREALQHCAISPTRAVYLYFTPGQRRMKSQEQLFSILVNDLFFILDYYKSHGTEVQDFSKEAKDTTSAQIIYRICKRLEQTKQQRGFRDFMDQMVDGLRLIRQFTHTKPHFEHILVDEYQDVNDLQIELINELAAPNSFIVGDPRQAIYGWRGSRVQHILERIQDHEIISLTKNYRSSHAIVKLMNEAIAPMNLPNLEQTREAEAKIHLLGFASQQLEFEFVIQKILEIPTAREEIFILARTNKQLNEMGRLLKNRRIAHVVKSDEVRRPAQAGPGEVTLATVHAIKGLEAQVVFVIGASSNNFPCKSSEHPVIDLIKVDTHDPEEEERRLFYVAISRAKDELYMTYSTKRRTTYLTDAMARMIKKEVVIDDKLITKLRQWRKHTAEILDQPAFLVMHDASLEEIAKLKPSTEEELLTVKGLGPSKIHQYGEAILKVVNIDDTLNQSHSV